MCVCFGVALSAIKEGRKASRSGWNGKGMYVFYIPGRVFKAVTPEEKDLADEHGYLTEHPRMAIKNQNGTFSSWVPSSSDCLAEDWNII